ncbi:MAG: hypothetical protein KatS3mg009_0472 [Acidimicrobiia bacterium]|nr:MAG: hypothetical protein KatS3mg009_0472 [Acidimicrobiia bacterium]
MTPLRTKSFRYRGGVVRVAAWHGRGDVASLALRGASAPPAASLERLLDRVRAAGFREVLTNALPPAASLPFVDAGFRVRRRLRLLVHDLTDLPPVSRRTRRARRDDRDAVLAVDAAAFDEFWRLDADGLRAARRATPSSQVRVTRGPVVGYGVFGRAGHEGYVQRLGVAPAAQGQGFGRALVADGLHWLRAHGATRAYVNTQAGNDRALALYEHVGFRRLPFGLDVLGRTL